MTNTQLVLLIVTIAAVAAAIVILLNTQRRKRLKAKFGPEYSRAIQESGSAARAEERLVQREKRVQQFNVHPLEPSERRDFVEAWRLVQAKFVDDPKAAVVDGDRLLGEIMKVRGYPLSDFEQQSSDLSVNHPVVVEHYRAGHDIALRHSQGRASTEDLRQAMIHYRKLFDDLVEEPQVARAQAAGG